MPRLFSAVIAVLTTTACHSGPTPAPALATCPATAPSGARPFDSTQALALAGTYELVMLATSRGLAGAADSGRIVLAPTDTLRRYYRHGLAGWIRRGERPLAGTYDPADHRFQPVEAEVEGATLYVGCRDCNDASPWVHRIQVVAPWGFWGHWEDFQTGIGRLYDTLHRPLPNPSGYYCAWRVTESSAGRSVGLPKRGA